MYQATQRPTDPTDIIARMQQHFAALRQENQQRQETPEARDYRLAVKHGLTPDPLAPAAGGLGSGIRRTLDSTRTAVKSAAQDAVKSAATSL